MSKFKVRLWFTPDEVQDANSPTETGMISMQVLEMDEALRGNGVVGTHEGISVTSVSCPMLGDDTVYLRGTSRTNDNYIRSYIGDRVRISRYRAAVIACGGEWVDQEPETAAPEPAAEPKPNPVPTPDERGLEYSVRVYRCDDDDGGADMNFECDIRLTRAELARLVSELIGRS